MAKFKKNWAFVNKKIKEAKENTGGDYPKITEDDIYTGLCIGVYYNSKVESTFEGVTKEQDKAGYLFAVKVEKGYALLRKEYTVSNHEKANLPKMLARFDIDDIDNFGELFGETLRLDVELKKAKASGKEYAFIDKIKKAKASDDDMEIEGTIDVPAFFFEDSEMFEVLDCVNIKQSDDSKPKRTMKNDTVEEEIMIDDDDDDSDKDFFEQLDA